MGKQTKITIILDGVFTDSVISEIKRQGLKAVRRAVPTFTEYKPENVTVEEIDDTPMLFFPACREAGQCKSICGMCYDLLD